MKPRSEFPVKIGKKTIAYLYQRGARFVVRRPPLQLDRKVLRAKTASEAVREMEQLFAERLKGRQKKGAKLLERIRDTAYEVIRAREELRGSTLYHTERYLERDILPWFDTNCPYWKEFDETIWESFVKDRMARGLRVYTCRMHFAKVMNRAWAKGLLAHLKEKPRLKNPDEEREAGRALKDDEVERLLREARTVGQSHYLIVLLGVKNGMRRREILSLEWSQIDFDEGTIHIPADKAKIKKARTFVSDAEALQELESLRVTQLAATRDSRGAPRWVFPGRLIHAKPDAPMESFEWAWRRQIKARAGVRCRFHDLRHTRITNALLRDRVHPPKVALYFGVSLDVIYRVYLHGSAEFTKEVAGGTQGVIGPRLDHEDRTERNC